MTDATGPRARPHVRVGILSHGTSQYDSRAHRVARSLAATGDTVTLYSRHRPGLPLEETVDGYRVVRIAVSQRSLRKAAREAGDDAPPELARLAEGKVHRRGPVRRMMRVPIVLARRAWRQFRPYWSRLGTAADERLEAIPATSRFLQFPVKPWQRARWFAEQVEPQEVWHGMWAASLPVLQQVRGRHGGHAIYDARDVYLRARGYASMPGWQRAILSRIEGRWARRCDAVIQVSEQYAAMMERDLGLRDVAVVRNCPERWDPPVPRPDRLRESLGIPATTSVVLYQGLLMADRGIEQAMEAILDVPDATLVLMGFGNQNGSQTDLEAYRATAARPPYLGRVMIAPAVPPQELLEWTASADISIMLFQPTSENHDQVTPQKLWESMAAGTPVLASDLPGLRTVVSETGCGRLVDPTDPARVGQALREMLALGPEGLRALGDVGLAAAHATYNWERQFEVLDAVYARVLAAPA
jgi:glycosyltransferase involved in cell wall biosynthesis